MTWFENNFMKMNLAECHPPTSGNKAEQVWVETEEHKI